MGLAETGRQQWREVLPMSEQSELTQAKRNELLDKITALLAKTTANGCTEAEAIAAAGLAEKLMAKYGFSLAEPQGPRAGGRLRAILYRDRPHTNPRSSIRSRRDRSFHRHPLLVAAPTLASAN